MLAFIRTQDELCVICDEMPIPSNIIAERNWRALKVDGPLPFTQVGVLASLSVPLSRAGVSIFVISTYDTDYILVKDSQLEQAVRALEEAGHKVVME